jgi:hypothetical protein
MPIMRCIYPSPHFLVQPLERGRSLAWGLRSDSFKTPQRQDRPVVFTHAGMPNQARVHRSKAFEKKAHLPADEK